MRILARIKEWLRRGNTKIGRKIYATYTLLALVALMILGVLLVLYISRMQTDHYVSLLEADNRRVRSLFSDVAIQAYDLSSEVSFDGALKNLLAKEYENSLEFFDAVNKYEELDDLSHALQEIENVRIYSDNPTIQDYKQFHRANDEVKESIWYQRAFTEKSGFWVSIIQEDRNTRGNSNLCLVRRIGLPEDVYHAVVVIQISDSYLRSRVDTSGIVDIVSLDDQGVVYSSRWNWYGTKKQADVDNPGSHIRYSGNMTVDGENYLGTTSTASLYNTNSVLYVTTMDKRGIAEVEKMRNTWALTLTLAILIPGVVLALFANGFAGRVNMLREEMHKARNQDYNIISEFGGNDELAEAFTDLKVMVQDIMDRDARMYEAELKGKELYIQQQRMEFKILASQINPHYLYNSLETIRMKALAAGNRDVADSIKILGKTLHYVMENSGITYTTLRRELQHVEHYLTIQKLRFGDRVDYRIDLSAEVDVDNYCMLPLLLQPVVENAVVHGLEVMDGPGLVVITVERVDDGSVHITVRDSGRGMSAQELQKLQEMLNAPDRDPASGVALYNINQRIRLNCGEDYGILLESEYGAGTKVIMVLPENFEPPSYLGQ